MKTIATFLMFALLAATMIVPAASAKGDADVAVDVLGACPTPTIDRVICIAMQTAGPVVDLVWDETWYHYGLVVGAAIKECNHLTSKCPLLILENPQDDIAFNLLA